MSSLYITWVSLESSLEVLPVPVYKTLIHTQKLKKTCILLEVFPHFANFCYALFSFCFLFNFLLDLYKLGLEKGLIS